MPFPELPADDVATERDVAARWERDGIAAAALRHRADAPRSFVFYEGPPTANGLPGLHHVFARTLKDVVCRHRLMTGLRVPRRAGWDTQGLPVEIEVQKRLGITTREEILALADTPEASIAEFNRQCRESVFTCLADWRRLSERMAYWLDYDDPYLTCAPEYIASCWAILARFHADGLLVSDFKVLPCCPRCQTGLSNHEVAQGYEDVQDPSVFVRFVVTAADWNRHVAQHGGDTLPVAPEGQRLALLVWTTTPWTLPANVAVAAGAELDYRLHEQDGEWLIVAEARAEPLFGDAGRPLAKFPGTLLVDLPYRRPFEQVPMAEGLHASTVRPADFVSASDGTGLVHCAPAFGVDDFALRLAQGLPLLRPVDDAGRFTAELGSDDFGATLVGRFVKDTDRDIARNLRERGLLFRQATVDHAYPHCWRCRSPLLYMARPSWYLRTTALRERMLRLNAAIDWHPPEIGAGRFGEWLANNVDWAISRERFWGTPLNVWICDGCGHQVAPAGFDELAALCGRPLPQNFDPHRPGIDALTGPCPTGCGGTLVRTPEVIDCWFDSGAMPFAQAGWPAAEGPALPRDFPADFVCEGLDQTRGWFYTLHVLATFLSGRAEQRAELAARGADPDGLPAFRSCLVNNLLLDAQGRKMSKSRGNAVAPFELFDEFGADAVRWFFLAGGQVWSPRRFDRKLLAEQARRCFGTLRNCYAFLALYATLDGWEPGAAAPPVAQRPAIDRWLLSRLQSLTAAVGAAFERLELGEAARLIDQFTDRELSNWYVRRNRARFWKGADDEDKRAAFDTLACALRRVSLLMAPITPFLSDWLWSATSAPAERASLRSVHLADWPTVDPACVDSALEEDMAVVLAAVELGRSVRAAHDLRTRQPLAEARVKALHPADAERLRRPDLARLVCEELNLRRLTVVEQADFRALTVRPELKRLGPRLGPRLRAATAAIAALDESALAILEAGETLQLALDGEPVVLSREDVLISQQGRPGYAVAADRRLVLALDTRLDEDLLAEGRAREIVNRVQSARKAAGLDVADRIVLSLAGSELLLAAARLHEALILRETLGVRLEWPRDDQPSAPAAQSFDVDGEALAVSVERVPG